MIEFICALGPDLHISIILILQFGIALIEYWLGKTDKTQSASILEILISTMKLIFNKENPWKRN